MKKLLIFHPYLAPYRIDLYNRLAQLFNVQVLLTGSADERNTLGFDLDFVNSQARFKFSYVEHGFYVGRHLLSSIFFKQIKTFRPDVVIAHELGINTLIAILLRAFFRYKLLVTIDDSPTMIKSYGKVRQWLQRFVIKYSEAFLIVHPQVKSFLENKYKLQNCKFIYFPIIQDDEKLKVKLLGAEVQGKKLLLDYDLYNKKIILFVGRLESVKCPDILLRAFHQLNDKDAVLVFVGDGSLEVDLKGYVKRNYLQSKVVFTGRLSGSSLYAWYLLAHVFILPSQFEPFGAVINEALVAGCFVIASDQVGANSLIDSSNGIIFRSGDEANLKSSIKKALDREIIYAARKENQMNLSFDELVIQLINFIKQD